MGKCGLRGGRRLKRGRQEAFAYELRCFILGYEMRGKLAEPATSAINPAPMTERGMGEETGSLNRK
jgi:hypothetical protein